MQNHQNSSRKRHNFQTWRFSLWTTQQNETSLQQNAGFNEPTSMLFRGKYRKYSKFLIDLKSKKFWKEPSGQKFQHFKILSFLRFVRFWIFKLRANSNFFNLYRNVLRELIIFPLSLILFRQTTKQFIMPFTLWIFIRAKCQRIKNMILFWYHWLLFSFLQSICRSNIQELIHLMTWPRESTLLISLSTWKECS